MFEKTACFKRFSATLIMLVVCLLVVFSAQNVSAVEFDNVKSYNEELKVVTITNAFGLGDVIGQAKLNTPLNVKVGLGYQKVAEFDIWAYQDYNDALKQFTFTDMKKKEKINREFDLKMKIITPTEFPIYSNNCQDAYNLICKEQIINYETKDVITWEKVTPADLKKNEILTIGIFTNVLPGDYVDWIPTIYGIEIEEWATWTEDINASIVSYWNKNEQDTTGSGTIYDSLFLNNGTNNGASNASGKIGTAYNFQDTDSDYIDVGNAGGVFQFTDSFSINAWINIDTDSGNTVVFGQFDGAYDGYWLAVNSLEPKFILGRAGSARGTASSGVTLDLDTWYMLTAVFDADAEEIYIYVNGNLEGTATGQTTIDTGTTNAAIGRLGANSADYIDGTIDEVGIWSRALNSTEIGDTLWNSGDGITYADSSGTSPRVTLTSPENDSTATMSSTTFQATVTDDLYVQNVTLYLDGVANETNSSHVNGSYSFTKSVAEGLHNWSILAYDNQSLSNQSVTWFFNYTAPAVDIQTTLNSPTEAEVKLTAQNNFNFTSTPTNTNVTNVTLYIWYTNGTLFDTNYTVLSGDEAVNTSFIQTLPHGDFKYNAESCSIDDGCAFATSNVSFEVHLNGPTVTIDDPDGTYDFIVIGNNETLNYNVSEDGESLSHFDSCWYTYNYDVLKYNDNSSWSDGGLWGMIYIEDKDNQNFTWSGWANFGTAPYIRIYKDANVSTGSYQEEIASGDIDYEYNFSIDVNENGWHYFYLYATDVGPGEDNYIDMFKIINPTSYAQTITYLNCSENTSSFEYALDQNNITVFANDTYGFLNYESSSWIYNLTEISQDYEESLIEGSTNDITANIGTPLSIDSVALVYNGTSYDGDLSEYEDDKYLLEITIDTPSVSEATNFSFYWNITYADNSTQQLTTKNQTIIIFGLDNCAVNPYTLFNFTVVDEDSQEFLNGVTDNVTGRLDLSLYNLNTGTLIINYSYLYNNTNPFAVCISNELANSTYRLEGVVEYTANDKFIEFYNFNNYTVNNAALNRNITLYNLNESRGQEFKITYKGQDFIPMTDITVQIQRKYIDEGVYKTVEIPRIGSSGYTIAHLIPNDIIYNFIFIEDGQVIDMFEESVANCQNPTITECVITLNALISGSDLSSLIGDDEFSSTLTYNKDTRRVSSTFLIASGDSGNTTLNVQLFDNFGNTSVCSSSLIASGGTLGCVVPGAFGNSTVYAYVTYDGEKRREGFISQNQDPKDQYGGVLIFASIILLMFMFGMMISDSPMIAGIFLILGSLLLVGLNLVYSTSLFGAGATVLWFIVAVIIVMIKGGGRR